MTEKKLIKRGDKFREGKLGASLKKVGATPTQIRFLVAKAKSYVNTAGRPTTLGIRKIAEAYLKKENPKAYKKYHGYKR